MAYQCKQPCLPPPIGIKGSSIKHAEVFPPACKAPHSSVCAPQSSEKSSGVVEVKAAPVKSEDRCGIKACSPPSQAVHDNPFASKVPLEIGKLPDPCSSQSQKERSDPCGEKESAKSGSPRRQTPCQVVRSPSPCQSSVCHGQTYIPICLPPCQTQSHAPVYAPPCQGQSYIPVSIPSCGGGCGQIFLVPQSSHPCGSSYGNICVLPYQLQLPTPHQHCHPASSLKLTSCSQHTSCVKPECS